MLLLLALRQLGLILLSRIALWHMKTREVKAHEAREALNAECVRFQNNQLYQPSNWLNQRRLSQFFIHLVTFIHCL